MLVIGQVAIAQDDFGDFNNDRNQVKTLIGNDSEVSGFGSFDMRFTEIIDDKSVLLGGHGGIILNKKFILGGGGWGVSTNNEFNGINPAQTLDMEGGYGGIILGVVVAPVEVVHFYVPVLIGGGGLDVFTEVTTSTPFTQEIDRFDVESSGFFVLEPGIEAEVNIARFFRISLGGSYRIVDGVDMINVSNGDLTGWSINMSFKFGRF